MTYDKHKSYGCVGGGMEYISNDSSNFSKGRELMRSVFASRGSVWDTKEERRVLLEMWQIERGIRLKPIGRSQLHIDAIGCGGIVIIDAWTIIEDVVGCKGKLPYTVERKCGA